MRLDIKDPSIVTDDFPTPVSKLEIRLSPERIARFSLPYSGMDRLALAGMLCPGMNAPVVFKGEMNGSQVTVVIDGRRILAVKHGMRGVQFDLELDHLEIYWSEPDGSDGRCRGSKDVENQTGIEPGSPHDVAPLVDPVAGSLHAEATSAESAP